MTRTEVASALARWVRSSEIDERDAARVESAFHEDLAARRLRVVPVDPDAFACAVHWLQLRSTSMRTLDALHLACAESAGAALVTLDDAFADAAERLGVGTLRPG